MVIGNTVTVIDNLCIQLPQRYLATLAVIGYEKAVIGYKIVGTGYLIAVIGNNVAVNGNKLLGD